VPGLTTGATEALQLDPPMLRVAGRVFAVVDALRLRGLRLGDRVTVAWDEVGAALQASRITLERSPA
jgi:hypothetical protein